MDPATGASTWALGSHRWSEYIGIFARNAVIIISHQRIGWRNEVGRAQHGKTKDADPICM